MGYSGHALLHMLFLQPCAELLTGVLPSLVRIRDNSDQGWQYQHANYVQELKDHGVIQSMSRKGNSMDDGLMENFFGLLKTEMFYDWEDQYQTLDDLEAAIENYIYYYNHDRIKERSKGLTPLEWREMRSQVQS